MSKADTKKKPGYPPLRDFGGITLSPEDSKKFIETLIHPPEPSKRLKKAYEQYKREVEQV